MGEVAPPQALWDAFPIQRTQPVTDYRLGMAVATVAALGWGYVYATMQEMTERMSPIAAMTAYYLFGSILLLPFLFTRWKEIVGGISADRIVFVSSASAVMLSEFTILWSVSLLGGTAAGIIEVSYPVWTAIFLYLILGEMPTLGTIIGGIMILSGIAVIGKFGKG